MAPAQAVASVSFSTVVEAEARAKAVAKEVAKEVAGALKST